MNQKLERIDELKEAAQPLVDFLYKYYNPTYKVIVNMGSVEITESDIFCPIKVLD